jgi:hypothetical protein
MAKKNGAMTALVVGVAALAGWFLLKNQTPGGSSKYKVGDNLYNPPDSADTFKIMSITTVNGVLTYNFKQNQTGVTFSEPVSLVDGNPSQWAKVGSVITPGMASWIPSGFSQLDLNALLTYPENPSFGKYILVTAVPPNMQDDTWIQPAALLSFTTSGGEWRVKPYPYPA